MSLDLSRLAIGRTAWIGYAILEVALFVTANATAKSASHPGTVSNIAFIAFVAGLVLALALGLAALARRRRASR
jgi:MYXO-CTERM domain-containing protein